MAPFDGHEEPELGAIVPDQPAQGPRLWVDADLAENRAGHLAAAQRKEIGQGLADAWRVIDGYTLFGHLGNDDRDFEVSGLPVLALTVLLAVTGSLAVGIDTFLLGGAVLSVAGAMAVSTVRSFRQLARRPTWRFRRALRRDLAAGRVDQGEAGVIFVNGRYTLAVRGRTLLMTQDAARTLRSSLEPHRAFFLPETGLVLWHEPADAQRAPFDRALNRSVAKGHGFDSAWLDMNRRGLLAAWQYGLVARRHLRSLGAVGAYSAGAIAGCHAAWTSGALGVGGWILSIVVFGLLVLLPAALLFSRVRRLVVERWAGVVSSVTGPARVVVEPGKPPQYFYACGDVKLRVAPEMEDALAEGATYRLFFTPRTRVLVGIEIVEVGPHKEMVGVDR